MPKVAINGGKVVIKGGKVACSCCCPTAAPTVEHDSVGRSLSKFGFAGWVDTNKRYLRVDFSGALFYSYHSFGSCGSPGALYARNKYAISGYAEFDSTGVCDPQSWLEGTDDFTGTVFQGCSFGCNPMGPYIGLGSCEILGASFGSPTPVVSTTQTDYTRTGSSCAIVGGNTPVFISGSITGALDPASEYTDAALIGNVQADIADEGFDGDWDDTPGSYRNLSPDGLSYSERQGKSRFNITGLSFIDGGAVRARYLIRFTPLVGAAVDGDETFQAFTFSTGMTHTAALDIPVPTENGTNTLVFLGWLCAPFSE